MKREWNILMTAIQFMTRIKVPGTIVHEPIYLQQAPRYFPVIGWIVGGLSILSFLIFSRYISIDTGLIASMITSLFATGAFHEDGLADVCDGMGGGFNKEQILRIMKDSRIGAYGTIGLIATLASKFVLLRELTPNIHYFIGGVLAAHSVSRLMPVLVMQGSDYVSDPGHSKSRDVTSRRLSAAGLFLSIALALAPYAFLPWRFTLTILPALLATYRLDHYFRRKIGGYTGDCLGAVQQVTELVTYLGFIVVWRYL